MITRCKKGHWYDTSVNKECPHCKQAGERLGIQLNDVEEDDKTISLAEAASSLGADGWSARAGKREERITAFMQGRSLSAAAILWMCGWWMIRL